MIEHKNIPDAQLHEPKGITSASNRQIYVANGSSSGAWRKVTNLDVDYSNKANNLFGWNYIVDNQYTSGSPLSITASTRTQVTNNTLHASTDVSRLGTLFSGNQFNINDLNSFYLFKIKLNIATTAALGTLYVARIELESNGSNIVGSQDFIIRGGSTVNTSHLVVPVQMSSTINNLPLKVYVTPFIDVTVYGAEFTVTRMYKET